MKTKILIVTAIFSIAIFGLTGCKEEHEKLVTHTPPYELGSPMLETDKKMKKLPPGVQKKFNDANNEFGILLTINQETGKIFVYGSDKINRNRPLPPIKISDIANSKQVTFINYPGSKCTAVITDGSAGGGCSHLH